jgi:hypothetical protein
VKVGPAIHGGMISSSSPVRTTEERQVRNDFNTDHGAHLPADLCLCIENPPTRWEVVPHNGDALEVLPDIDDDVLAQVFTLVPGCILCLN